MVFDRCHLSWVELGWSYRNSTQHSTDTIFSKIDISWRSCIRIRNVSFGNCNEIFLKSNPIYCWHSHESAKITTDLRINLYNFFVQCHLFFLAISSLYENMMTTMIVCCENIKSQPPHLRINPVTPPYASVDCFTYIRQVAPLNYRESSWGLDKHMGVGHGDRGTSPPEFGVGDANANCPSQILSHRYKKSVLWPSKYTKIRFRLGLCPEPRLGSSPRRSSRLGRGHPSPYPTSLGTDPPSALALRPP